MTQGDENFSGSVGISGPIYLGQPPNQLSLQPAVGGNGLLVNGNSITASGVPTVANVKDYGAKIDGVTDDSAAIQAAHDAVVATGGVVYFPAGTTLLNNASFSKGIKCSANNTKNVQFLGATGSVIKLSANSLGAFTLTKIADQDSWQNYRFSNLTVDVNNVSPGSALCEVFGTGGNTRVSIQSLTFEDIHILNAPANQGSPTGWWLGFGLKTRADNTEAYLLQVRDIVFEDVRIDGCNEGIEVSGVYLGSPSQTGILSTVLLIDRISMNRIKWDSGLVLNGTFKSGEGILIGGSGVGLTCRIQNCDLANSTDVGIEIDCMNDVIMENVKIENCVSEGFYHTNYGAPVYPREQLMVHNNCKVRRTNSAVATMIGYRTAVGNSQCPPRVIFQNCEFYATVYPVTNENGWSFEGQLRSAIMNDCRIVNDGIALVSTGDCVPKCVNLKATPATGEGPTELNIQNLSIQWTGTTSGSSHFLCNGICINDGVNVLLDVDGYRLDQNITGGNGSGYGIDLNTGGVASATLRGSVRDYSVQRMINGGTVKVGATARLTIDGLLMFENCNWDTITADVDINFTTGTQNADKIRLVNCSTKATWRPIVTGSITVSASPFAYQNLDIFDERVTVQGGTVSKVEIGDSAATYTDVGVIAGMFHVSPGEFLRVTYSGLPTMKKIPVRLA